MPIVQGLRQTPAPDRPRQA